MARTRTAALLGSLALGVALTVGACSEDGTDHGLMAGDHENARGDEQPGSDEPNTQDLMFATRMLPHHKQAVEMSGVVLSAEGVSPDVVELAEEIKAAQQPEVELMTGWIDEWRGDMAHGMNGMGDMEGMGDGMLDDADGVAAERLYLEGMIDHHEGAIEMAKDELEDGQYPPALNLAREIIDAQSAEIVTLKGLLR